MNVVSGVQTASVGGGGVCESLSVGVSWIVRQDEGQRRKELKEQEEEK
jgi:hypothetical protein